MLEKYGAKTVFWQKEEKRDARRFEKLKVRFGNAEEVKIDGEKEKGDSKGPTTVPNRGLSEYRSKDLWGNPGHHLSTGSRCCWEKWNFKIVINSDNFYFIYFYNPQKIGCRNVHVYRRPQIKESRSD